MTLRYVFPRALALAAALALSATSARAAGGINLSWNDCGSFGIMAKSFACTSNAGFNTMVGSAITGVDLNQLNGMSATLDLQVSQPSLPSWWQLASGGCRFGALFTDFNFLAGPFNCVDPWSGAAVGALNYNPGYGGPNWARIRVVAAISGTTPITGTDEYYFFKVTFTNARTVGNGSCAGCQTPACIVLNSIFATQPSGVGDYYFNTPIMRNYIEWQSGPIYPGCYQFDAAKPKTWGAVKSLYR